MSALYERTDLSVIIPVYNLEKHIAPMLASLKEQEYGDYKVEIIFVLNNCTDRSEEIIRESGLSCTVMNCTEQGCGCARNMGFEHSHGERIWFLDGDDWLLSNTAFKTALDGAQDKDILRIPFTSNLFTTDYFSMVWQYVFKRSLIEDIRFRKVQPAEDDDYMGKVFAKIGIAISQYKELPALERPLYFYNYLREGSNMWRYLRGEDINATQGGSDDAYKLQILTPHWQEEPWEILPLLDSIALQQAVDFTDIGLIIVYDGDEATPLPEDEWKAKYPFEIQFVHAPHGGVSAARNAALDAATADYVMFCDADDMFCHMCGLDIIFTEIDKGFDAMTSLFFEETHLEDGSTLFVQHPQDHVFVHGKVYRREYLMDNDLRFNPALTIHEDRYFNILACELVPDPAMAKYMPHAFYLWRWRDNSICRRDADYLLRTHVNLIDGDDALVDEFLRRGRPDLAAKYVTLMVLETYYTLQRTEWQLPSNQKYRTAVNRRFRKYMDKHRHLWVQGPNVERMRISANIRNRHIADGMDFEAQTLDEWIYEVYEDK